MNVALRMPTSVEAFLAWEERQELRYEFDGVRAIAMVGASWAHGQIVLNIAFALRDRLRKDCRVAVHDTKLRVAHGVRYPDVMVVCSPVANDATFVTDPVLVIEVLSDGTSRTDRLVKSQEYRDVPSLARYLIVEQSGIGATLFARPDWRGQPLTGADTLIALPEIGAELRLGDCYAGIDFPAEDA